ncbi:hypothetical protein ACJIZ3_018581 [Penstemon smallii]|uniref:Uncharacterized protein n=1 Tax=Penstemon smallii TaxID=265156 RepID=A0ABD3SYR2_9LAMI
MASSFSQSPIFSSLLPIYKKLSTTHSFSPQPNNFFTFKNSKISSSNTEPSPNPQENSPESQIPEQDPIKLAFAKAKSYKKSIQSNNPTSNPPQESIFGKNTTEVKDGDDVPLTVKLAMEKAKEYKKNKGSVEKSIIESTEVDEKIEGLKSDEVVKDGGGEKEVSLGVKLALEKAKEYKKNKGFVGSSEMLASGLNGGNGRIPGDEEIIKNAGKKKELTISNIDFVGLGFSDKKSGRDVPAGLVPISDPFPEGDLPEVEILVGDSTNFGTASTKSIPIEEDDVDLYKPKVSTWGVFPRPNDISKTYGGGRTLRPGEALETAEEKAAKQARTKQLLAAYKSKFGLNIDPKIKSDCEKALKEGDSLMDLGKLKEALPFYEQVMEKMPFKSELHGLAAVQWSICLDSLSRSTSFLHFYAITGVKHVHLS